MSDSVNRLLPIEKSISYLTDVLDGGADPNEVDEYGRNALSRAAQEDCRPPLLQRLLARIHDVNAGDKYGMTALIFAAWENHLDVVISLLNHPGIDVNVQDCNNEAALHYAAVSNHPAIVSQLLSDDNINANLKNDDNRTPLKYAIYFNRHECVKISFISRSDLPSGSRVSCCKQGYSPVCVFGGRHVQVQLPVVLCTRDTHVGEMEMGQRCVVVPSVRPTSRPPSRVCRSMPTNM